MPFPLAGLLRVRGAQERVAAEDLSRARAESTAAVAAEERAATGLRALSGEISDPATLLAMAAARSAGQAALADLQNLTRARRAEEETARLAHVDARRDLRGLERLEGAHRARESREDLRAEQGVLDEIATVRAGRDAGSAA